MKVVHGVPPNYAEICAAFPAIVNRDVLIAFGGIIFIPSGKLEIPQSLYRHECVHDEQQDGQPAEWWRKYIDDPVFRREQELKAHVEEYIVEAKNSTRNQRRAVLRYVARKLCSPIYGWNLKVEEAKRLITRLEHGRRG